jgi:hypothetical protein
VAQRGPDARNFVCGDACADAGSADHNAPLGCPVLHRRADKAGDIRKVDRIGAVCAKILDLMPLRTQIVYHRAFEWKAGVIATNS